VKNDSNSFSDMIPAYLANRMSVDERQSFDLELSRNKALRKEVRDLAPIYQSVMIADQLGSGHVEAHSLVAFAEGSEGLDEATRYKIEAHIELCPECRERVELCRSAADSIKAFVWRMPGSAFSERWFKRVTDLMFPARIVLRPLHMYCTVAALAVLLIFAGVQWDSDRVAVQSFNIRHVAERGVDGSDELSTIAVAPSCEYIELTVSIDIKIGCHYRWELFNHEAQSHPNTPYVRDTTPVALLIPVDYLVEGTNTRRVSEVLRAGDIHKPDTSSIDFNVSFFDK